MHRPSSLLALTALALVSFSCEKTVTEASTAATPKIKITRESIHLPERGAGAVVYEPAIAENSFLVQTTFNRQGLPILIEEINSRGKVEWREIIRFDKHGNLLEAERYHFKKLSGKRVHVRDEFNRCVESNEFDADGRNTVRRKFQFDETGRKTGTTFLLTRGALVKTAECEMDEQGDTLVVSYFSDGELTHQGRRHYVGGRLAELVISDASQRELKINVYKYDERGNTTETVILNGSRLLESKTMAHYDAQDRLVETLTYGIRGNLTEHVVHQVEYDAQGNWVKDVRLVNRKPVTVRLRKIAYY